MLVKYYSLQQEVKLTFDIIVHVKCSILPSNRKSDLKPKNAPDLHWNPHLSISWHHMQRSKAGFEISWRYHTEMSDAHLIGINPAFSSPKIHSSSEGSASVIPCLRQVWHQLITRIRLVDDTVCHARIHYKFCLSANKTWWMLFYCFEGNSSVISLRNPKRACERFSLKPAGVVTKRVDPLCGSPL